MVVRCRWRVAALVPILLFRAGCAHSANVSAADAPREPVLGDLTGIEQRQVLRVLVSYSSIWYAPDRQHIAGAAYLYYTEFAQFLQRRRSKRAEALQVAFIPVMRDRLTSALADGSGDLVGIALPRNPDQEIPVDLMDRGGLRVAEIVVTGRSSPALRNIADLGGHKVYVRASSSYAQHLQALNESLRQAGKLPVDIVPVDENLDDDDILDLVNANVIDATVVADYEADLWSHVMQGLKVRRDLVVLKAVPAGIETRQNVPQLRSALEEYARLHPLTGVLHSASVIQSLRRSMRMHNPNQADSVRRFYALADEFSQTAKRYELDPLLLAAQAFQESGLDQDYQSDNGAIGIMQINPQAAAADPINVDNIEGVPNNLQAAGKYLRWIEEQYFNDPNLSALNRQLFAIAAYHIGPVRVARLRERAAAEDIDASHWFGPLEILAGQEFGRRTLSYMRNVLKYYFAYQIQEQHSAHGKPKSRTK